MNPPDSWHRERLPADSSLFDLLWRLHEERSIEAGPDAMLRAARLFRARAGNPAFTVDRQANALASLFATDAASYARIHTRVCDLLGVELMGVRDRPDEPPAPEPAPEPQRGNEPAPLTPALTTTSPRSSELSPGTPDPLFRPLDALREPWHQRVRRRLRGFARGLVLAARRLRGRTWAVILALTLVGALLPLFAPERKPPIAVSAPTPTNIEQPAEKPSRQSIEAKDTSAEQPAQPPLVKSREQTPATDLTHVHSERLTVPPVGTANDWRILAWLTLAGAFLIVLGGSWLMAPRRRRHQLRHLLEQARARRRDIERGDRGVIYDVPRYPPFAISAMDDAATLLGRARGAGTSAHLDIDATLDRCLHSAGQLKPIYAPSPATAPLLVFVDIEKGDHPFLDGVDFVLDHWRRTGVPVVRLDYRYQPTVLYRPGSDTTFRLTEVARRQAGAPLLLFSRLSDPTDTRHALTWPGQLTAWPARAMIDLDPRPDNERNVRVRSAWQALEAERVARYPFTRRGLVAAARQLTRGHAAPVDKPALSTLSRVERAVVTWATIAAYVPDPTWTQLEAIRGEFSDVLEPVSTRAHVQRLLDWAGRFHTGTDPEGPSGKRLDIPRDERTQLIAAQRHRDAGKPTTETLEWRARRLLIEQLERAQSEGESALQRLRRELKLAFHRAVLEPARQAELLSGFAGTAVEPELRTLLTQERQLQVRERAVVVAWPRAVWETVTAWTGRRERVPVRALAGRRREERGWPARWLRRLAVAGGVIALAGLLALAVVAWPADVSRTHRRTDRLPEVLQVEDMRPERRPNAEMNAASSEPVPPAPTQIAVARPAPAESVREPEPERDDASALRPLVVDEGPGVDEEPAGDITRGVAAVGLGAVPEANEDLLKPASKSGLVPDVVKIRGGRFRMGTPKAREDSDEFNDDEWPVRTVRISTFYMCQTEITQAQWNSVMGDKPSECRFGCSDEHPVQSVSWLGVVEYLNKLSKQQGERPCYDIEGQRVRLTSMCEGYRLPTEAEWEYAARAGSKTAYHFGDDVSMLGDYAWYSANSGDKAHPVGTRKPNGWGLYDMHGNVWEWVWDWYADAYQKSDTSDPRGPENGGLRVLRGGGFNYWAGFLRSALRFRNWPTLRYGNDGFRCARDVPPALSH